MDPFLEAEWDQIALPLCVCISDQLNQRLPETLAAVVRRRVGADYRRQCYVEIIHSQSRSGAIAAIELVHPSNKSDALTQRLYLQLQQARLAEGIHIVEIDLTRRGNRAAILPAIPERRIQPTYVAIIRRAGSSTAEAYPMPLDQRLPSIPIPLGAGVDDAWLDIQSVIDQEYENGRYDVYLDYSRPLDPPLSLADAEYAAWILK
jgi:hypothetical protein